MTCPHIVTSDEGTSYCKLAEAGVRAEQTLADDAYALLATHGAIGTMNPERKEWLARYRETRQR